MTHPSGASGPDLPGAPSAIVACFEQLPSALFVYEGPENRCVAVNAAARQLLGQRPQLGRTYREAVPDLDGQRIEELLDEVCRTGEPVTGREWRFLVDLDDSGTPTEFFLDFTIVPMRDAEGGLTGTMSQVTDVTEQVRARAAEAARAGAAERRYQAAREVVLALQGNLLPEHLPVLPGARLAAHYLVAAEDQDAGGDWFDAVALPGGRVALVVGDVVGHGAGASAVMGQLRAVLNAFLLEDADPAAALVRLDRFVARVPGGAATTVCVAVLDPATGELGYAGTGHPPPLVISADGATRYLPCPPCGPLATASGRPRTRTVWLDLDDIVLLYTDGLVERPDRDLATGQEELRRHAADALSQARPVMAEWAVDRVCRLSLERMTVQGHGDDVSLIAAQRTGRAAARLYLELSGIGRLAAMRHELHGWLARVGAEDSDVSDIQLAVGEAVSNALEHGYQGAGGRVVIEGEHDTDGQALLTVSDRGRWRPPPATPDLRGRGLVMMRACMDSVQLRRSPDGTTVRMSRLLHRAPRVGSPAGPILMVPPGQRFEVRAVRPDSGNPRLVVRGTLDLASVEEFRRRVRRANRGGSLPLDVDLTGVTHLASAGVHALHELAEQLGTVDTPLRLIAPPGCAAAHVLWMTGLGHLVPPGTQLPGDQPGPAGEAAAR